MNSNNDYSGKLAKLVKTQRGKGRFENWLRLRHIKSVQQQLCDQSLISTRLHVNQSSFISVKKLIKIGQIEAGCVKKLGLLLGKFEACITVDLHNIHSGT